MELQPWKLLSWGVLLQFQRGAVVHVALLFLLNVMALENAGMCRRTLSITFDTGIFARESLQMFVRPLWWDRALLTAWSCSWELAQMLWDEPAHVSKFFWKGEEEKKGIWPIIAFILTKWLKLRTLLASHLDWPIVPSGLEIKPQEWYRSSTESLRAN